MADFFEIDFLDVETDCSGDAIALRYEIGGTTLIHLVDSGYQVTGPSIVKHVRDFYGGGTRVDHVVVTHCDRDHTGGLKTVLSEMEVGALWMLRPWIYAEELLQRFPTFSSADRLRSRLRGIYSNLVELEELAEERGGFYL
jgi:glyoxylase-like metal-dependent hydrolase (beta-lactamase superfamily II)